MCSERSFVYTHCSHLPVVIIAKRSYKIPGQASGFLSGPRTRLVHCRYLAVMGILLGPHRCTPLGGTVAGKLCLYYRNLCHYSAKWQRVRAVQMFVEHVISKYDIGLEIYGMRLHFVS